MCVSWQGAWDMGFGLSQNTAEKLAKEGYGYREILAYFYKGAVIGQAGNL